MTEQAYALLHPKVQKWVYQQQWADLRPIQKKAVGPIMAGDQDIIVSAATAAGKTEAFFLPACSVVQQANATDGFAILYISPLKALINDQYRRLESLCQLLEMELTPWHGDSPQSKKRKAKQTPSGILLITPESLESLFIREAGWLRRACHSLRYIVIDEFHAFIGSERGYHLLSLLNRLDSLRGRQDAPIPRVALSATLGDIEQVAKFLRPNPALPCLIITDDSSEATIKLQVRGYIAPADLQIDDSREQAEVAICQDLYQLCRGDSHLVFANSRNRTEGIAARLRDFCTYYQVPNEFFPHHGSLAKDLRESLEARLQKENLPTTAVCTMTLELGIDIGKVNSVAQVTAPHSVASLRQRLGRSGRRAEPAILRMFITENQLSINSGVVDKLRMELLQCLAMVRLLLANKWFEPADTTQFHFSTYLHQILALIAQWGGLRADQIYALLSKTGPFNPVKVVHFKQLLIHMSEQQLITQLSSGELVLGVKGEKLVDHYTFYAVFKTPQEYRIICKGKTLGTLPIDSPVLVEQHIVFGGRRWQIKEIDSKSKCIMVQATQGGRPPNFGGEGMSIHDRIRQEMYQIAQAGDYRITVGERQVDFIDATAKSLFVESNRYFQDLNLSEKRLIQVGETVVLIPWLGDKKIATLVMLLIIANFKATAFAGVIEIEKAQLAEVTNCLVNLIKQPPPTNAQLAAWVPDKSKEKYDELLPEALLIEGYGQRTFDVVGTFDWLREGLKKGVLG